MDQKKRMHPMMMPVSFFASLKDIFFVFIILFVLNYSSEATWVEIGRILFFVYLIYEFVSVIVTWWRTTYSINESFIEIEQGLFTRKHHQIPYDRIQNVQTNTPFYLRPFHLTTLTLETGAEDEDSSFTFTAITKDEAQQIEYVLDHYTKQKTSDAIDTNIIETETDEAQAMTKEEKNVHFNPTKKVILKASVLSFSYLLLIPVLASMFSNIDEVYDLSATGNKIIQFVKDSWFWIGALIILFIIVAICFGIMRTYLKYGRYEISSDHERIYIRKGVLNEQHFSIRKQNVQAVHIKQSLLKRMLKIAEVKLISAGGVDLSGEEVNSLYPFLPIHRAYTIIEEILPEFAVQTNMESLPKKSLVARMCQTPVLWVIGTIIIVIFFPTWWPVSIILFLFTIVSRLLDYYFTHFLIHGETLQVRTGGFFMTTSITTREKIIEFKLEQNFIQKRFDLANMETANRSKPVHTTPLYNIPMQMTQRAFIWYTGRNPRIEGGLDGE
ncbi:PH domain-containing protein [Virgibacillus sp.]|uniref:PH domain-containing protein n=1 Tax=Virgibacillus sp. TaxID=1872700 RepID=UPI00178D7041|nr:PH domain-containing protein [Virgibacillus sp.]NWO13701.1 PH domain-containing protein [Virgibacillus sp.]